MSLLHALPGILQQQGAAAPSGWTVLQADTFTGTGSWSDGDWLQSAGTWERASDNLAMTTSWGDQILYWNAAINDDQAAEVRVQAHSGTTYSSSPRLQVQSTSGSSSTGYAILSVIAGASNPAIYRNGAWAANTTGMTIAAGDLIRIEVLSGVVKVYQNGVERGSYTDGSPITGGTPAIWISAGDVSGGILFDDLTVEEYV